MVMSSRRLDRWVGRALRSPLPGPVDRPVRTLARQAARRALWLSGRLQGLAYHLEGRQPASDVDDRTLAQRVRSSLGPLERELDVPRVRVTVLDGIVVLLGVVATDDDVRALVSAASDVPGVHSVTSRLRVGLQPGDTRPSVGRATVATSRTWRELVGASRGVGLSDDGSERAAQAVLATLLDCLPSGERAHVLTHLPDDVRRRAHPPLEVGRLHRPTTATAFVAAVADRAQLPVGEAQDATRAVLDALRDLVPEEVGDVAAVLPTDLKSLWAPQASSATGAGA